LFEEHKTELSPEEEAEIEESELWREQQDLPVEGEEISKERPPRGYRRLEKKYKDPEFLEEVFKEPEFTFEEEE
jgi:hypothetical protein